MIKQVAIDCLSALPDTADWEDIQYSLYVLQKIEKGMQEALEGKGISIEDARQQLGIL